ncbi:MAG: AAA family ATPase [Nocardioidaceae bacterium]
MSGSKQPKSGFGLYRPGSEGPSKESEATKPFDSEADGQPEADHLLADTAELDLYADEARQNVRKTLAKLDAELIGLTHVKRRVGEIAALLLVDRARRQFGLTSSRPTLHMSFTGGPGTGKTTVAQRMAQMLHAMGYIRTAKVHTVTRDDLVGQFIGHTAPKTKEAIARAAGGVLFIDEAYYLHRPENERDYGQEVIEILLQEMESERTSLVVVFAGYPDRMESFFTANPGLSSRVPHHISFDDYTHDELTQIAELMVAGENFRFSDSARTAFSEYLALRMEQPRFSNARSVRNAVERCRLRQAKRLVELQRMLTKDDLVTITEEDVYGSSVFDAAAPSHTDVEPEAIADESA